MIIKEINVYSTLKINLKNTEKLKDSKRNSVIKQPKNK